jgi:cytosine/adenosine deaminase-related metal-dependent hydrolase
MRKISCAYLISCADKPASAAHDIAIDGDKITSVSAGSSASDVFAMPALVNCHDHGRSARPSSIGGAGKPLESWLSYAGLLPSVDPYLNSLVSCAHSALGGAGTVMMHYTRAQGLTDLPTEAAEVARAAKDVGIRVGFAVSMKDRNPLVYGPSEPILAALSPEGRAEIEKRLLKPPLKPAEFIALVEAVSAAAHSPNFDVQFGPNGVQWCSNALLEAIADASKRSGRHIHMHLLETRYQREWLDKNYPDGVVKYLDSIGFLSPRLTLAHCVWVRPDELEILAARGVTISANHSSNLHLRSGVPPVQTMLAKGCNVALGIDAGAFDEDDDAVREMRVAKLLQVGIGFDVEVNYADVLKMAVNTGHLGVMNKGRDSRIEAGEPADLLLLDWGKINDEKLRTDIDPIPVFFARANAGHIVELIVNGRTVVKNGTVANVDYPAARREVLARMREGLKHEPLVAAMPALEEAIKRFYQGPVCC